MFRSTEPQVSSEIAAAGANSRSSRRRGATLVEFAFCFPVFLLMTAIGTLTLAGQSGTTISWPTPPMKRFGMLLSTARIA